MITKILDGLFGEGGLLRVRALLAFGFTAGGVAFVLLHQTMPPNEYNTLWGVTVTFYFTTRNGSTSGGSGASASGNGDRNGSIGSPSG